MWTNETDATVVVHVEGNLTVGNRRELQTHVLDALARGARTFAVDLARAEYVDTAALGTLVMLAGRARAHGGSLRLAHVGPAVQAVLELTKLDGTLTGDAAAAPVG